MAVLSRAGVLLLWPLSIRSYPWLDEDQITFNEQFMQKTTMFLVHVLFLATVEDVPFTILPGLCDVCLFSCFYFLRAAQSPIKTWDRTLSLMADAIDLLTDWCAQILWLCHCHISKINRRGLLCEPVLQGGTPIICSIWWLERWSSGITLIISNPCELVECTIKVVWVFELMVIKKDLLLFFFFHGNW